jgi:hypothetical protein
MKIALVTTALCAASPPVVIAQQGGYPASPSHGIVGAPNPDGSLRYGKEPTNDASSPSSTAGSNDAKTSSDRGDTLPSEDGKRVTGEKSERGPSSLEH